MASDGNPWSVPVVVMQIPETGLHRDVEASAVEREAIARLAELRSVASAAASFDLVHAGDGRVHVTGRVTAQVRQTCVVTLEPVDNVVDEAIDLMFMPPEQIRDLADLIDDEGEADDSDPPEPIERGIIDLGRVATDALYLGLDPYPRKPDAVFEQPAPAGDGDEHPFAALKALQDATGPKTKGG